MEYLSKYLQRSFANSRISVIRWELLLSSESVQKMKLFSDPVTVFENRFVHHRERKIFHPSSSFLSGPIDRYSSYDDVYRHTHADYQQPTIAWIFLSILVPSRGETISCLNKEDGTNKADATPDKQICIQLWRNLSGVINFIPAGDKSIGIVGNLIYTSLPRRNDPLSVESKGDGNHLSPLSLSTLILFLELTLTLALLLRVHASRYLCAPAIFFFWEESSGTLDPRYFFSR